MAVALARIKRRLSRDHDDRGRSALGDCESSDRVDEARSAADERHARLSAGSRPAIGHVQGGGLLAAADDPDVSREQRVVNIVDLIRAQAEHLADPERFERARCRLRP